jgi:hypothetical protein
MKKFEVVDLEKIKDTFTPCPYIKWEKDNGVVFTPYYGTCYVCGAEKTVYWLIETNEAFCLVCRSTTDLKTQWMKDFYRMSEEVNKEYTDPKNFDEKDYDFMQERIRNHRLEYDQIKSLIYSPEYQEIIPEMRKTKIYKMHSKTISDEDRLFLVIYLYRDRNGHRTNDMTQAEEFNDFKQWLHENRDISYMSRSERRRLERERNKIRVIEI